MKKIVALMIVVATLLCMSSCSNAQHEGTSTSSNNTETQETNDIKDTGSNTQTIEKDEKNLTASLIVSRVKAYSAKYDLDPISDLETKPGKKEEQVVTSFRCINGLVSVSVTETNGIVDYIISLCLPSQVIKKVPSDSLAEAAIGAYAYSMIPLFSCEPTIDEDWHQEQFYNAPDEGDSSMVIRSYASKEWYYTAMVGEAIVTCVAARYCSQCKNNTPKVSFTSGAQICDNCNNSQGGGDTSNSGNTTNGGNTSSGGNASNGGNKTPYTTTLSGSAEVYKLPNNNSSFVQNIGPSGIYTIVEETYDSTGNLWGKLKSGIGWVMLSKASTPAPRTCPQCGESEPDAIFTEDWQSGDICFGCSYDNFHGGKDAKAYCAQCGADCTYRGLAGDGLCDDCYRSSNTPNTPAACEHSYTDATCTAPKICTLCGEISGAAFGHTYSAATCTAPRTCSVCGATSGAALGHNWNDITETVYHEEQGHYEDVQDAKKVQKYRCPRCGYNAPTYATKDSYYAHFDSAHGDELNSTFDRDRYEMVSDWVYETVTVWVVDQKAYTETVVTGRKCTICEKAE